MAKHMRRSVRHSRERGFAIMFYATMLFFVIGCVGLAVDVGTIYMIKARLSAAADAAALAAGRSVNLALTVGEAQTNAITTADQFFSANFPNGYFNTIGTPTVTPTLTQETDGNGNPNGVLDIQVNANVSAPTYFMNIFNVSRINVAATGTASRRGLVLMLVLDISSSMNTPTTPTACQAMVTAAQNFITLFSPYDQIGLVTFDYTAHLLDAPTTSRTQVNTDIGNITCGNNTNTISALDVAYQQIKGANLPLALNTIVLFTDGSPNGLTAKFPARAPAVQESRWGPSVTTPAQSGSTYGITNNCADDPSGDTDSVSNANTNAICINMPVICTDSTAFLTGTIAQGGNQNSYGGDGIGLVPATDSNGKRTINGYDTSTVSFPATCNPSTMPSGNAPGTTSNFIRQYIAYIPNTDIYGNDLVNGVPATGTSPYGTITNGFDTRKNWIYQVNQECSPDPTVQPNCKNVGGLWSNFSTIGTGSNFFPSTNPYVNANVYGTPTAYLRPDQPNTIVAASMNGTMAEAFTIRSDTTYHPVIHTIYLTGNGTDSVDHEFLAIVANAPSITALPYDATYNSANDPVLYANPAYRTDQETGKYLVTSDKNALSGLFAQLASEVLRLSH
jgi:Flp pilus assembly protein TadG